MVSLCHSHDAEYFDLKSLQIVHLKSCPSIKVLFYPSSFSTGLSELKELKLEACEDLEEVVDDFMEKSLSFPRLSKVELKSLSKFRRFTKIGRDFSSLKTLIIEECPCLEEFTVNQAILVDFLDPTNNTLREFDELRLDGCNLLLYVASFETPPEKMKLKKVFVSNCYALKMVILVKEIPNSIELLHELDELILINLPNLTHIIDKECVRLYQNLRTLQVERCGFLHWLPIPVTLTNMKILDCDSLHKTVVIRKEKEEKEKVIFSQLKEVILQNLRNLYTAFPFGSEFPSLEILKITNCPSLMTFVEERNDLKEHKEQVVSTCFFPNSLSLEKLKVLYIIDQHIKDLWHYSLSSESFCQIENLTLRNNNKLLSVISSRLIIRFNNMKDLTLDKCESLITIFILEDDHPMQEMFPQLRKMSLSNLNNLKFIWNKEPNVPFFSNLVSLFIVHCDSIESLFSLSSSKYLKKLKLLRLYSCKELKQVISSDEDENVSTNFPQMKCLVLKDLPKLVNFSHYHGTLDWPSLQTLRVSNVPSMKIFSRGNINTPLLRSIDITFIKKLWFENLNQTISFIYNNPELIKVTQIKKEEQLLQQDNNG